MTDQSKDADGMTHRQATGAVDPEIVVSVRGLHFGYGKGKEVLSDISLDAHEGTITAVLGPSGSGKSTLLKLISNMEQAPAGTIAIKGMPPATYLGTGDLAFMFQKPTLLEHLNVRDNIGLPLKMLGRKVETAFVDELLELVGLKEHAGKFPQELSGGMQTRVALARAFVTRPKLLLLDEPFSALDVGWKRLLYMRLERLRERFHASIIIVTHDIQEALLLSNHIVVLGTTGRKLDEVQLTQPLPRVFSIEQGIASTQEQYKRLYNLLAIEGLRSNTLVDEARNIALSLLGAVQHGTYTGDKVLHEQVMLRQHVEDPTVWNALTQAWAQADDKIKLQLMWDVMVRNDTPTFHKDLSQLVLRNISTFNASTNDFYGSRELLLSALMQRINDPRIPKVKKWVYLCSFTAVPEKDRGQADEILRSVARGDEQWREVLDLELAKGVARDMLANKNVV